MPIEARSSLGLPPAIALSGESGDFSFEGLLGPVTLVALSPLYPGRSLQVELQPREVEKVVFRLSTRLGELHGVVRDAQGRALEGARIVLESSASQSESRQTQSDARGEWRFDRLPSHAYRLRVSREGYALLVLPAVEPGTQALSLRLEEGRALSGQLLDRWSRRPIADAQIEVVALGKPQGAGALSARVARQGSFSTPRLAAGHWGLVVRASGYGLAFRELRLEKVTDERALDLGVLEMLPAGAIEGQVQDRFGSPVVGATLRWQGERSFPAFLGVKEQRGQSEARGAFRFRHVDAGYVRVFASHPRCGEAQVQVRVVAQKTSEAPVLRLPQRCVEP
mgnify:FL=1